MTDCILLLQSTDQGFPAPGGVTSHFVRVGGANMHTVAQMNAGGVWPGSDCAVADIRSVLLDRGIDVPVRTLERIAGTGPRGTSTEAIVTTLASYHIPSHIVAGTPAEGWVMNSAWGGMVSPVVYPLYARASLGRYVQLDDGAVVVGKPKPPVTGQPEAAAILESMNPRDVFWRGSSHTFKIVGTGPHAGALQHHWYSPGTWNGPEILPNATGLTGGQHIEANVSQDGAQLVVSVNRTDGRTARFTQFNPQVAGQPSWREDEIT